MIINNKISLLVHRVRLVAGDHLEQERILKEINDLDHDIATRYHSITKLMNDQDYIAAKKLCLDDINSNSPLHEFSRFMLCDMLISDSIDLDEPKKLFTGLTENQKHVMQAYCLIERFNDHDADTFKRLCGALLMRNDLDINYSSPKSWGKALSDQYTFYSLYKRNPTDSFVLSVLATGVCALTPLTSCTPIATNSIFSKTSKNENADVESNSIQRVSGQKLN